MDDLYAIEDLQRRDWSYFIDRLLKVSEADNSSFELFNPDHNRVNMNEIQINNDTFENLEICKNFYSDIYENVGCVFQKYLQNVPDVLLQKIQGDIRLNLFVNIDLRNGQNPNEILKIFDRFFFKFGRFPTINELTVVLTGDVLDFVKSNDIISPSELYEKISSGSRGLVCIYFLATLNIHLGGEKIIPKNAMSEFYQNLSMQALSKSNDKILVNFNVINQLNKNLNSLIIGEIRAFENPKIKMLLDDFDRTRFVVGEQSSNDKIEDDILSDILNDKKIDFPTETDHISLPNMAEEIKQQKVNEEEMNIKALLKKLKETKKH